MIAVTEALTLLEIFLINNNYLAGDHLTIADITILANVTFLEIAVEFDLTSYPNIWNWYNRLRAELPYYDPLTKKAHDEFRALIQSVRDANEEWSFPVHQCAFVPNDPNGSHCSHERSEQYKRLFLNQNDQQDAARIMAAIRPVFGKSSSTSNTCSDPNNCHGVISSSIGEDDSVKKFYGDQLPSMNRPTGSRSSSRSASRKTSRNMFYNDADLNSDLLRDQLLNSPSVKRQRSSPVPPPQPQMFVPQPIQPALNNQLSPETFTTFSMSHSYSNVSQQHPLPFNDMSTTRHASDNCHQCNAQSNNIINSNTSNIGIHVEPPIEYNYGQYNLDSSMSGTYVNHYQPPTQSYHPLVPEYPQDVFHQEPFMADQFNSVHNLTATVVPENAAYDPLYIYSTMLPDEVDKSCHHHMKPIEAACNDVYYNNYS